LRIRYHAREQLAAIEIWNCSGMERTCISKRDGGKLFDQSDLALGLESADSCLGGVRRLEVSARPWISRRLSLTRRVSSS
jgi:hypothetical protein